MAKAGIASRRQCEEVILAGRVSVNGQVVSRLGTRVDPGRDRILLDGEPVRFEEQVYLAFHKPKGMICSSRDTHGRPQVIDAVKHLDLRLYSVGRLDLDSEGLILLTNDGDFANRILHPREAIEKVYRVILDRPVQDEALNALREGIDLGDFRTSPARVRRMADLEVEIVITEGKKRQVRRMFDALGFTVSRLIRTRIGPIRLDGLPPGQYRDLSKEEINLLGRGE